eukprot:5937027-Amphidinium_carterae.1
MRRPSAAVEETHASLIRPRHACFQNERERESRSRMYSPESNPCCGACEVARVVFSLQGGAGQVNEGQGVLIHCLAGAHRAGAAHGSSSDTQCPP